MLTLQSFLGAQPLRLTELSREHAWLAGLTLVGKDALVPPGARVGRAAVVGIGATAEDFGAGALEPGASTLSRAWYEGVV